MELGFIKDQLLRQRTEDSVEYIYAIYEESKGIGKNDLYRTETYRVIILYTVSIIEAILFYIYETRDNKITKTEYKEKSFLPSTYINDKVSGKTIVATEKISEKTESEISLKELVQFLKAEKVLKYETSQDLLKIIQMRNSVHLRQKTSSRHSIEEIEKSLELLSYILKHAPRHTK